MPNILIVEDESIVAWDIKEALEQLGHTVLASVATDTEAVQMAATIKPDLVLMDIQLQGQMAGIRAAQEIYSRFSIPIVYLTAHSDGPTLEQAAVTNPYGYLVKPFQKQQLDTTVRVALRQHQLAREEIENQSILSDTLTSIGDAVIATDRRGRVTLINPTAERITGWTKQDALGKPIDQVLSLVCESNREPIENPGLQTMRLGYPLSFIDGCLLQARDGSEKVIGDTVAPIVDRDGDIVGSVMVFQDKTAFQLAQNELHGHARDLEGFQLHLISQLQQKTAQHDRAVACLEVLNRILDRARAVASETEILDIILHELGEVFEADYSWAALHDEKHGTSMITSEYINPERSNDYPSALGTEVDLKRYRYFYSRLIQKESWINPSSAMLPRPYRFARSPAQQILVCPIVAFPNNSFPGEARTIGEIGLLTTFKAAWSLPQTVLVSRITSYGIQLFRRKNHSNRDVTNALVYLNQLRDDFISSASEELLFPLINIRQATGVLHELVRFLGEDLTETGSFQARIVRQTLSEYLNVFQEEWQKEFDSIDRLLSFKALQAWFQDDEGLED
ncbi:response regulator [Altericista sp. CCNU0014]|uniref:response regulator n=1 Tax=Altericista sp. CCNU0014 TaxID=3082949 RepID=UPI00384FF126